MATSSAWVVDASVVTKWHLKDEDFVAEADFLLRGYQDGTIGLLAPALICYEVGNALELARRAGRVDAGYVSVEFRRFLELGPYNDFDDDQLLLAASSLAAVHGIEIHDGVYLALGGLVGLPILTADRKLRKKVGDRFPDLVWIGDLETS